jgi:hypothetical protein
LPETTVVMIEAAATRKPERPVDAQLVVDHGHGVGGRKMVVGAPDLDRSQFS